MATINHPSIGDHLLTAHNYVYDQNKDPKFSLLKLDGGTFDETLYPLLFEKLGSNVLESRSSGDPRVSYKIVGDLNE
jgi:hypothetical protein